MKRTKFIHIAKYFMVAVMFCVMLNVVNIQEASAAGKKVTVTSIKGLDKALKDKSVNNIVIKPLKSVDITNKDSKKYIIDNNNHAVEIQVESTSCEKDINIVIGKKAKISKMTVKGKGYINIYTEAKATYTFYETDTCLINTVFFPGSEGSTIYDKKYLSGLTNATKKKIKYYNRKGEKFTLDPHESVNIYLSKDKKSLMLYGFAPETESKSEAHGEFVKYYPITVKLDGKKLSLDKPDSGDMNYSFGAKDKPYVMIYYNFKKPLSGKHKVSVQIPGYKAFTVNVEG